MDDDESVLGSYILPYRFRHQQRRLRSLYHYIVGFDPPPAAFSSLLPPVAVRNPLYAHKLSLVGFWSLALFYPFVGIHHYLYSPIADWAETIAIVTSMLLIIPVWTVLVNFFGTVKGRWEGFGRNLPAKFLIMGALMYLAGCFQGSLEALRSIQQPTHFSDFVITLTSPCSERSWSGRWVVLFTLAALFGRELWSWTMGNWSFWLITVGISTMGRC
jgi:cytochrome c oxidase cbb3-type subunit 1